MSESNENIRGIREGDTMTIAHWVHLHDVQCAFNDSAITLDTLFVCLKIENDNSLYPRIVAQKSGECESRLLCVLRFQLRQGGVRETQTRRLTVLKSTDTLT